MSGTDALDSAVDTFVALINSFKAEVIRRGGPDVCDASRTLVLDGVCHRAFQR
jgi:hypothetical protein